MGVSSHIYNKRHASLSCGSRQLASVASHRGHRVAMSTGLEQREKQKLPGRVPRLPSADDQHVVTRQQRLACDPGGATTWPCGGVCPPDLLPGCPTIHHPGIHIRSIVNPRVHSPFMTWVVWVRMLGFRSRSAIATATPAEEDMIADVTALQVTDSHTVFSVLPHKLDPWPVRCPFRQRAAKCQRRCMTSATSTVLSCVLLRADTAVAALMTPLPLPRVPSHHGSFLLSCRPRFAT